MGRMKAQAIKLAEGIAQRTYPEPVQQRSGCKVGWYYYDKKTTAHTAARIARRKANRLEEQGYDFGYLVPGTVRFHDSGPYKGLYEVVVP